MKHVAPAPNNRQPANTNSRSSTTFQNIKRRPQDPGNRKAREINGQSTGAWQADQAAVEHIEQLHQLEGFLCSALIHVMRMGFQTPTEWPALLRRADESVVQAPEHVVDRAVSMLEELCLNVDREIRNALDLAPNAPRRKYKLLQRRAKTDALVDNWLPAVAPVVERDLASESPATTAEPDPTLRSGR